MDDDSMLIAKELQKETALLEEMTLKFHRLEAECRGVIESRVDEISQFMTKSKDLEERAAVLHEQYIDSTKEFEGSFGSLFDAMDFSLMNSRDMAECELFLREELETLKESYVQPSLAWLMDSICADLSIGSSGRSGIPLSSVPIEIKEYAKEMLLDSLKDILASCSRLFVLASEFPKNVNSRILLENAETKEPKVIEMVEETFSKVIISTFLLVWVALEEMEWPTVVGRISRHSSEFSSSTSLSGSSSASMEWLDSSISLLRELQTMWIQWNGWKASIDLWNFWDGNAKGESVDEMRRNRWKERMKTCIYDIEIDGTWQRDLEVFVIDQEFLFWRDLRAYRYGYSVETGADDKMGGREKKEKEQKEKVEKPSQELCTRGWWIRALLRPIRRRFRYHFFGNRKTNRPDKPEWFFSFASKMMDVAIPFVVRRSIATGKISSGPLLLSQERDMLSGFHFMIAEKVKSLSKIWDGGDSDQQNWRSVFLKVIQQMMVFDDKVASKYRSFENSVSFLGIIMAEKNWRNLWISLDTSYVIKMCDTILSSPRKWAAHASDGGDESSLMDDEVNWTETSFALSMLLFEMKDRYGHISNIKHRIRFFMASVDKAIKSIWNSVESSNLALEYDSDEFWQDWMGRIVTADGLEWMMRYWERFIPLHDDEMADLGGQSPSAADENEEVQAAFEKYQEGIQRGKHNMIKKLSQILTASAFSKLDPSYPPALPPPSGSLLHIEQSSASDVFPVSSALLSSLDTLASSLRMIEQHLSQKLSKMCYRAISSDVDVILFGRLKSSSNLFDYTIHVFSSDIEQIASLFRTDATAEKSYVLPKCESALTVLREDAGVCRQIVKMNESGRVQELTPFVSMEDLADLSRKRRRS